MNDNEVEYLRNLLDKAQTATATITASLLVAQIKLDEIVAREIPSLREWSKKS